MSQGIYISKQNYNVLDTSSGIAQTTDTNTINACQGGTGSSGENAQALAQSFISTTEKVKSVDLKLFKTGSPADSIQLDIVSTLGGTPIGSTSLSSANINSASPTNFAFSSDVNLTIGSTYYLQVTRSGIRDISNYWSWYIAFATNPYPNGVIITRNNNVWSSNSNDLISDFYFNIYSDSTTNPNNLIFSSDLNTFKILAVGTAGGTVTADPTTFSVAHGIDGIPAFWAFAKFPDGLAALPNETDHTFTATGGRYWTAEIDPSNMSFNFYRGGGGNYGGTVKYYVFEPTI